jgi:Cys-tRNA(Pro)/Cys-tRNA(Cys) deacylase
MAPHVKTNAIRMIESAGIQYGIFSYDYDEDSLDALTVAHKIGAPEEQVFKTLVARSDRDDIFVFCIPGSSSIDFKKAAKITGSKKIDLIGMKELLPLTGYVRGGCSPVGMKKKYPLYIDEMAMLFDSIYVSAGIRGLQIKINPADLSRLCSAIYGDITG